MGNPMSIDRREGFENQAKASSSRKPQATRKRATKSAYGFGKPIARQRDGRRANSESASATC